MKSDYTKLFFIHRTDVEPIPKIEKNPKGIHHGLFMHLYDPPESKNSRFFNVRYIDPTKGDDGYMFHTPFRRMQRMGAATRTDTIDGSDWIFDDADQWDGQVLRNTYKYIGKKELLCSRRDDVEKWKRIEGQVMSTGLRRERLNLYVVEVRNRDPSYLYEKRVWYVDPESSRIVWQDFPSASRSPTWVDRLAGHRPGPLPIWGQFLSIAVLASFCLLPAGSCLLLAAFLSVTGPWRGAHRRAGQRAGSPPVRQSLAVTIVQCKRKLRWSPLAVAEAR